MTGRLAPTPSGHLHLGNALAFGAAWLSAKNAGGTLLLRVEDLDRGRARTEVAEAQRDDLCWLGLGWDAEVPPQSRRDYPLDGLDVYRCDCPRSKRLEAACACRDRSAASGAWRVRLPPGPVQFVDRARGLVTVVLGPADDPVVRRADGEAAYPLAVVLDDARDGVTEVVRGGDLLEATAVQLRIAAMLGLTPPTWLHVPLLVGPDGRKLGKSHGSTSIRELRAAGWGPDDVWRVLLPMLGVAPGTPLVEARLDPTAVAAGPIRVG